MMNSHALRLMLLVSCCHGLVPSDGLSFASVEQFGGGGFLGHHGGNRVAGTALELPLGLSAIVAGWLVDRYGAERAR